MRTPICVALAMLAAGALATPAAAQQAIVVNQITTDLDQFVGRNLFGMAHANLGVVSAADPYAGIIGVTGRHGEYALISTTMLTHNGVTLYAPTLTAGDIKVASEANFAHSGAVLGAPNVIIVEPPAG